MSKIKRTLALCLALVLMLAALSANAFAADHTYRAYQIFKGSQGDDGQLSSVEWGTGINSANFLSALKAANPAFSNCETAAQVAKVLDQKADNSDIAKQFAKIAYANRSSVSQTVTDGGTVDAVGYYLIVDETTGTSGTDDVLNVAILQITSPGQKVDVDIKVEAPTMEKKVKDKNDTSGTTTDWQDSADWDIGDSVPFKVEAQLKQISDFETYKVIFHDTMDKGLTYDAGSAKLYIVNGASETVATSALNVTVDGQNITFSVADVKALGAKDNAKVRVEFSATLNENAVIGPRGNDNKCYLEFSNNPMVSGEGENHPTGRTPEDLVRVFTYGLIVNKVDKEGKPVTGAQFKLSKKVDGEWKEVAIKEITDAVDQNGNPVEDCVFNWTGLDDGDYKIEETVVPPGYNGLTAPIEFSVTADHQIQSDDPKFVSLTTNNDAITADKDDNGIMTGNLLTNVVNEYGVVLPETGGTGTTAMYIVGGIMLLGACVVLVSKRRMTSK